ncbi:MAG: endonuclease III [Desulfovibrionaceae bacterium]|nr:endonuclease III [Desulfovibrionaceae bacterium]
MNQADKKKTAAEILTRLGRRYPNPRPALDYTDAWGLLVATVLSAQCTDARVNQVTPELFRRWPGVADLARAEVADIEEVVRSTGFFRNKAKNLKAAAQIIAERHKGQVPRTMDELVELPGVARKTANIVLYNAFGVNQGVAVDTHVKRLAQRLGLSASDRPEAIEAELMALFPQPRWGEVNHYLVFLGREVCTARRPRCANCPLEDLCPKKGLA